MKFTTSLKVTGVKNLLGTDLLFDKCINRLYISANDPTNVSPNSAITVNGLGLIYTSESIYVLLKLIIFVSRYHFVLLYILSKLI